MRHLILADACYGASLLAMPLVGVGLAQLLFGVDLGTGLQPAYLLLALAWVLRVGDLLGPRGRADRRRLLADPAFRRGLRWGALALAVVLLSGLGLVLVPALLLPQETGPRFLRQLIQLGVMAAFLIYPAVWTRGPRRWRWTTTLLAWGTGLQLGLAALLAANQLLGLPVLDTVDRGLTSNPAILAGSSHLYLGGYTALPRLRGSMCEPLYLGSYLVAVIPLLAWRRFRGLTVLAVVALLLTWSRSAWAAAAAGLIAWWLLRRRAGLPGPARRVWMLVLALGAAAVVAVILAAGPETLLWPLRRVAQTLDRSDWSNLTRYYSVQAAWRCFLESPLLGVGWGQFAYHFYALVDLPGLESQFTWPVVNSIPLLVLAETGLLGFAVFAALNVMLWCGTWRVLSRGNDPARAARLAATGAAAAAVGCHLLLFSQYNLPHLWVVPGLWLAALVEEARRS